MKSFREWSQEHSWDIDRLMEEAVDGGKAAVRAAYEREMARDQLCEELVRELDPAPVAEVQEVQEVQEDPEVLGLWAEVHKQEKEDERELQLLELRTVIPASRRVKHLAQEASVLWAATLAHVVEGALEGALGPLRKAMKALKE